MKKHSNYCFIFYFFKYKIIVYYILSSKWHYWVNIQKMVTHIYMYTLFVRIILSRGKLLICKVVFLFYMIWNTTGFGNINLVGKSFYCCHEWWQIDNWIVNQSRRMLCKLVCVFYINVIAHFLHFGFYHHYLALVI
jgi:hypothetical protein